MKIKFLDIVNGHQVLPGLSTREMPFKMSYAFGKNIRLISQEYQEYDKLRLKILNDNWPYSDEKNKYDIPDNQQKKWHDLHNELLETEIEFQPYSINTSSLESTQITPGEAAALWFIFDEDGKGI